MIPRAERDSRLNRNWRSSRVRLRTRGEISFMETRRTGGVTRSCARDRYPRASRTHTWTFAGCMVW